MTRAFRLALCLGALASFSVSAEPAAGQAKPNDDVKIVSYTRLGAMVKENRGKVVVVDFWATW